VLTIKCFESVSLENTIAVPRQKKALLAIYNMHTCAHAARLAPTVSVPPSAVSHCSSHRILSLAIIFLCSARFTFGGHGVDQAIAHVDLSGPQRWDKGPVYREGAADHTDKNRPANTALIRRYRDRHSFLFGTRRLQFDRLRRRNLSNCKRFSSSHPILINFNSGTIE